jgi:hypothetical protein
MTDQNPFSFNFMKRAPVVVLSRPSLSAVDSGHNILIQVKLIVGVIYPLNSSKPVVILAVVGANGI